MDNHMSLLVLGIPCCAASNRPPVVARHNEQNPVVERFAGVMVISVLTGVS